MQLREDQINIKKVAFVATVYRHLEAFHLPFMKLFQDKGYEVHAYGAPDHGKDGILEQGVICHDTQFSRNPFHFKNFDALKQLISSFKREQFQMMHVHTPVAGIFGRIAARVAEIPIVIYTAHGFHFFKGAPIKNWLLYYPAELLMARWTDFLITINQEDFQRARNFPVKNKILFVPGVGLDTSHFVISNKIRENKRHELALNQDEIAIVSIAELIPRKNQIQLIKSVERLVQLKRPIRCFFVGNGQDEVNLKNYVQERELTGNIKFLGFRRDIPELLAASDIVALLSKHEGLTKALMEAMAAGKPIITTNVRGNRDLIIEGENGFTVPVDDTDKTVESILKLVDNPELRSKMSLKNIELARQYDLKVIIKEMESIYRLAMMEEIGQEGIWK